MDLKKELGQFMTTNYLYILKDMYIPDDIYYIIEPFCGDGDLLNFISDKNTITLECYDIVSKSDIVIERDTLLDPPNYENKFVITNPPYLSRNKSKNKKIFNLYNQNDLYKCFISSIIKNNPIGGIIIIPLNFISSIRTSDIKLRKDFLQIFSIIRINIFEESVFNDTNITVCSIQFEKKKSNLNDDFIKLYIFPSNTYIETYLNENNNYTIGGEIYNLTYSNNYKINRLTRLNIDIPHTNILVKCIDDNLNNQINLSIVDIDQIYIDNTNNLSARSYLTLQIIPQISLDKQKLLTEKFNEFLQQKRKKYHSLFLSNYRESNDISRKRISFNLVYLICSYLLDNIDNNL